MNTNEVRWKLHNYYVDAKRIEQLKDDLKEYRLMDGVGAQIITDMPTSHNSDSTDKTLDRLDYIRKLECELDCLMRVRKAIDEVYLSLQEPHRSIIEMRYFITPMINDVRRPKYNWLEIAEEVNYTEQHCKNIDVKIINQIQIKIVSTM